MDGKETQFKHLHVWRCQAKVKIYNPHERKLYSRTTSGYFIGYPEKSKEYRFYCPNYSTRIVEFENDSFIENGEVSGSTKPRKVKIQEVRVQVPLPLSSSKVLVSVPFEQINDFQEKINNQVPHNEVINNKHVADEP